MRQIFKNALLQFELSCFFQEVRPEKCKQDQHKRKIRFLAWFFFSPVLFFPFKSMTNQASLSGNCGTYDFFETKYSIEPEGDCQKEEESETNQETECDEEIHVISSIKQNCETAKQPATQCCSNPNSCNGLALDLAQYVAPLTPALYGAYKSYKISKESSKDLSHEETVNKMCNVHNTVQMGGFMAGLLSQLTPLFKKHCSDKISKCEKQCNKELELFRNDFKKCFSGNKKSAKEIITFALRCVGLSKIRDISETQINSITKKNIDPDEDNSGVKTCTQAGITYCYMPTSVFTTKESANNKEETDAEKKDLINNCPPEKISFKKNPEEIKVILKVAKAYSNSTKNKKHSLSANSNEREIVHCSHQPDRVLTSSERPGGPVPPPAIQICRQAVNQALEKSHSPSPHITQGSPTQQPNASFTGGETKKHGSSHPLLVPPGEEKKYGLQPEPDDEEFDSTSNKPSLAKKLPGWKPGSSGSPSGGSSGGGLAGGGGAGGYSSNGDEDSPPSYASLAGGTPDMFSGGGSEFPSGSSYSSMGSPSSGRKLADGGPSNLELKDMALDLDPKEETQGKSIFQMASQRIKQFCADYSCSR